MTSVDIQSLFHNLLVQDAVFNMEADGNNGSNDSVNRKPASAQNEMLPVILALQSSFAHMKLCHNSVVDLTRFVGMYTYSFTFASACLYIWVVVSYW